MPSKRPNSCSMLMASCSNSAAIAALKLSGIIAGCGSAWGELVEAALFPPRDGRTRAGAGDAALPVDHRRAPVHHAVAPGALLRHAGGALRRRQLVLGRLRPWLSVVTCEFSVTKSYSQPMPSNPPETRYSRPVIHLPMYMRCTPKRPRNVSRIHATE